jgi:SET domain-containing protein
MTNNDKAASPPNPWFRLRRSRIQGRGAFAITHIPRGTRIIEYTGEKITGAEGDRRYPDEDHGVRHHTFLFILNKRLLVDGGHGGNESRFINHSCDPNCDVVIERGHIWIESRKPIPKGAELTYDYEFDHLPEYTEKDLRFHRCRCGSANCRGTIVKVDRRRKAGRAWTARTGSGPAPA